MTNDAKPYLSIVIPFHNEEGNLILLVEQLDDVLSKINHTYEIILIDDGSTDNSLVIANKLVQKHPKVYCIELSRNFGQEQAIQAGLENALGEVIITMDSDLQHPPNFIPVLLDKFEEGYDVVNTSRKDNNISWIKKIILKLFYTILNTVSGTAIPNSSLNFKLMSRPFLNEFLKLKEKSRFDRGMIEWMGFNQCCVQYQANERNSGSSKYSFFKLIPRGIESITSFSARPLRLLFILGGIIFGVSLIGSITLLVSTKTSSNYLLAILLLLIGLMFLMIGILAEYVRTIYNEVKNRPRFVIKRIIKK